MSDGCGHAAPRWSLQYNWQADRASRRLHDRLLHFLRNALYRLSPAPWVDGEVIRGSRTEYGVKAWRIMWLDPPETDTRIGSGRVVQNMAVYRLTFYGQTRLKSRPPPARSPHSPAGPRGGDLTGNKLFTSSHHETAVSSFRTRFISSPVRFMSKQRKPRSTSSATARINPGFGPLLARSLGLRKMGGDGPISIGRASGVAYSRVRFCSECGNGIGGRQVSSTC
ncbi:hypothetical protein BDW72DRAFT_56629 [Aspergillus terricola var. indicus]